MTEQSFAAIDTFDATFGKTYAPFVGGGVQVLIHDKFFVEAQRVAVPPDRPARLPERRPGLPARHPTHRDHHACRNHRWLSISIAPVAAGPSVPRRRNRVVRVSGNVPVCPSPATMSIPGIQAFAANGAEFRGGIAGSDLPWTCRTPMCRYSRHRRGVSAGGGERPWRRRGPGQVCRWPLVACRPRSRLASRTAVIIDGDESKRAWSSLALPRARRDGD